MSLSAVARSTVFAITFLAFTLTITNIVTAGFWDEIGKAMEGKPMTADELAASCVRGETAASGERDAIFCLNYILGVANAVDFSVDHLGATLPFCPPERIHVGRVLTIFLGWMAIHPEMSDEPAIDMLVAAVGHAFPCK